MEKIVPGLMLREKKAVRRRTKKKERKKLTPRMEKAKELVKEGYSIKKALELAGYSQSTINSRYRQYLGRLDLPELLRGLKQGSVILNYKVLKVLDEEMDKENSRERIRAADVAVKNAKLHLVDEKSTPEKIVFQLQTFKGDQIILNAQKTHEVIDVDPEADEGG